MNNVTPAKNLQIIVPMQAVPTTATFSEVAAMGQVNQAALYLFVNIGSLSVFQFEVQFSYDKTNWFAQSVANTSAGSGTREQFSTPIQTLLYTITADPNQPVPLALDIPSCYQYMRVEYAGSGTVGAAVVQMTLGGGSI